MKVSVARITGCAPSDRFLPHCGFPNPIFSDEIAAVPKQRIEDVDPEPGKHPDGAEQARLVVGERRGEAAVLRAASS